MLNKSRTAAASGGKLYTPSSNRYRQHAFPEAPEVGSEPSWVSLTKGMTRKRPQEGTSPTPRAPNSSVACA